MNVPRKEEKPLGEVKVTDKNFSEVFGKLMDSVIANPEKHDFLRPGETGNPITIGARVSSPVDWAKKQTDRAIAARDEWLKGVKSPRKHPIEAAIKADKKRTDRLAEAERQGKWLKAMSRVNEDLMYQTIDSVGAGGFAAGIEARRKKIEARVGEIQPLVAALATTIDAMPDATDADREKRLLAARRGMMDIGKKRRGI